VLSIGVLFFVGLLSACGPKRKTPQVIVPKVQLDALDKEKGIEVQD